MNGLIFSIIDGVINALGQDLIFIILFAIIIVAFVLDLLFSIARYDYGIKERLWFLPFALACTFCCCGFCARQNFGYVLPFLIATFSGVFFGILMLVREKVKPSNEESKQFIKFIDSQIKNADSDGSGEFEKMLCQRKDCSTESLIVSSKPEQKSVSDFELDFQHVKNVISRLDYLGLKDSDKRQVKELENALLVAEKGEFDQNVKSKINDGLGALLKIMSKYGV